MKSLSNTKQNLAQDRKFSAFIKYRLNGKQENTKTNA